MAAVTVETRPAPQTQAPRAAGLWQPLLFPALLAYLEGVLHLASGMELRYLPICLAFALSAGACLGLLPLPRSPRGRAALTGGLALLLGLIYAAEGIAKQIFGTYYPLRILQTATGNRLGDYAGVVLRQILRDLPLLVLLFLPAAVLLAGRKRWFAHRPAPHRLILLGMAVLFHLVGMGLVHLPWSGDLTPAALYRTDTHINDQVEQLGLCAMLRLDIRHTLFPPARQEEEDFSALAELAAITPAPTAASPAATAAPAQDLPRPDAAPTPAPTPEPQPQVSGVDLAALADGTDNGDVAWLARYFDSVTPTTTNGYTGMFRGYNVIQLVLEGFSGYALDPELTPTLYRLAHEGFVFSRYYTALHFTSTSGAECQTLLGLYPKDGSPVTMQRTGELGSRFPFSLAQQLGGAGYRVLGYHNNVDMYGRAASHSNLGYDWRYYRSGLPCEENAAGTDRLWPQRDTYMIEASTEDYLGDDTPFHVYYLTVSGHTPYEWNRVAAPYRDLVADLPYSEKTRAYVAAAAIEADRAVAALLQRLEEAGQLDNTLIVATGDHIPYADVDVLEELAGRSFGSSEAMSAIDESDIDFSVYQNTLILWSANMEEPVQVDKVCCQVDILPTLSNLLGLSYDSRMLAGQDILSDSEGLVIFASRCWQSDRGFYNRYTQTFTPAEGVTMTPEEEARYLTAMKQLVSCRLESTERILDTDFYRLALDGTG